MEEIKENDFVRTKQGYIAKCVEVDEYGDYYTFDEFVQEKYGDKYSSLYERGLEDIVKHSSNIIDLIEVGDYVNGYKVIDIKGGYLYIDKINLDTELYETLVDYQVFSVVTKEQFANAEYRLEE